MKFRTTQFTGSVLFTILSSVLLLGVVSTVEAKSNTLSIKFTDFCCGYGKLGQKVTVTLKNTNTDEILGKHTFKFKTLDHCADGGTCKGKMNFETKHSHTGDTVSIRAVASGPSGGSDGEFFTFDANKHKYSVRITLDEVGCGLKGFTCD